MLKTKYLLPLILILLLTFTLIGDCWVSGYDQRIKVTIDHTKIDSPLSWFPVIVHFTATQGEEIFSEFDADSDYMKCAFTKADGTTQLYAQKILFDDSESKANYRISRDGWEIPMTNSAWTKQGTVLEASEGWDGVAEPSVIYEGSPQILTEEDNVFKMWYRRGDSTTVEDDEVCYAESADGISWTKYDSNPVLGVEAEDHYCPFVFKYDSVYYMYVHSDWTHIDRYYSSDGLSWSKDQDNTLEVGADPAWDDVAIGNVFVWVDGEDDWRMLYDGSGGVKWQIGYATSTDGKSWSKSESNPVLSGDGTGMVGSPYVHKIDSTYYMWHSSAVSGALPTDQSLAKSTNLTSWTKVLSGEPIFYRSEAYEGVGETDSQVADVHIIEVDGTTYMFYEGVPTQSPPPESKIVVATTDYTIAQIVEILEGDTDFYYYYDDDAVDNTTYIGITGSSVAELVYNDNFRVAYGMDDAGYDIEDACDSTTGWLFGNGTISLETVDVHSSSGSLKFVTDAGQSDCYMYYVYPATADWSSVTHLKTWIKGDSADSGEIYIFDDDLNWEKWDFTYPTTWTLMSFDLSSPDSTDGTGCGDWSDIKRYRFDLNAAEKTARYDEMRLYPNTIIVEDSTSNRNYGTKSAATAPTEITGKIDKAQDFDGTNDYIDTTDSLTIGNSNSFTVSAICKTNSNSAARIFGYDGTGNDCFIVKVPDGSNKAGFYILNDDPAWTVVTSTTTVDDNDYHHIAASYDHSTNRMDIYVDGVSEDNDTDDDPNDFTSPIRIGAHSTPTTEPYEDIIDEYRISDNVRSAAWIKATYNSLWDTLLTYGSEETEAVEMNVMFIFSNF